jgi:hypothetical protein
MNVIIWPKKVMLRFMTAPMERFFCRAVCPGEPSAARTAQQNRAA